MISPSNMLTDQSEGRSSYSYGSKNSSGLLAGGFEASHILKRKIGGLARRNIAMETTRNAIEEMTQTGFSKTGMFGGQTSMHMSKRQKDAFVNGLMHARHLDGPDSGA